MEKGIRNCIECRDGNWQFRTLLSRQAHDFFVDSTALTLCLVFFIGRTVITTTMTTRTTDSSSVQTI
jgi:hypothetical protein